jgi:hypothetical protein
MRFGCSLTIVTDQGTHFINDAIRYLTNHFILRHTSYIVYYPQGNELVEFTNKVFGSLLTKWLMKIKMLRISTCPQSYFHIEPPIKLELVIPPFNWYMSYIHYYLLNIYYHLDLMTIHIHNLLEY